MLQTLYIENIAVIEKTSIDFNSGLNVLTGETGAGKSIIIDAINAIMGQRTSRDIIRTGEKSAFVSAQFDNIGKSAEEKLAELGFDCEDGILILQRTLSANGKSVCKINGRPATVSMLRALSGKTHRVITGVCITGVEVQRSFAVISHVTFKELEDAEIDFYVDHYEPFDKAGAWLTPTNPSA